LGKIALLGTANTPEGAYLKIGLILLPLSGHLNPFLAVARVLKARGHHRVYLGLPDCASAAQATGIDFFPHSQEEFPLGSVAKTWGPVAKMHGMEIVEYALNKINIKLLGAALKNLPMQLSRVE
jgi:zeaxanthin glucosyltransferase